MNRFELVFVARMSKATCGSFAAIPHVAALMRLGLLRYCAPLRLLKPLTDIADRIRIKVFNLCK